MFGLVVLMAWPLSLAAVALQPGNQGFIDGFLIYFGVSVLAVTLPTAIWSWREPDPDPEQLPA